MSLFDCSGEIALVIGATGVLGGAIAEGLAKAGTKVLVGGRNEERGAARVAAIEAAGGQAAFVKIDASDRSAVEAARDAIEAEHGTVTILVNGAGGNDPKVTVTDDHKIEAIERDDQFCFGLAAKKTPPS